MEIKDAQVLIIEDDRLYREFMKTLISKNFDANVIVAKDPKEGFDYLKEEVPDLVILDMELPMMDGFQILKHIRSNPRTKDLAVIPCTVLKQQHLILNLVKMGISDFIDKKIPPKQILMKIRNILTKVFENKKNEDVDNSDDFMKENDISSMNENESV